VPRKLKFFKRTRIDYEVAKHVMLANPSNDLPTIYKHIQIVKKYGLRGLHIPSRHLEAIQESFPEIQKAVGANTGWGSPSSIALREIEGIIALPENIDNIEIHCPLPMDYRDYLRDYLKLNHWMPIVPIIGKEKTDRLLYSLPPYKEHLFETIGLSTEVHSAKRVRLLHSLGYQVSIVGTYIHAKCIISIRSGVSIINSTDYLDTITHRYREYAGEMNGKKKEINFGGGEEPL